MEQQNKINNIKIENAKIRYLNFSGTPDKFNPAGNRNFIVLIPEEIVEPLIADGWNIKRSKPRDDEEIGQAFLQVAVKFAYFPPKVVMLTSRNKVILDEQLIGQLDTAEITNVDLVIRPYMYEVNGKTGIKAYLKTMYVTIEDDEFADKYDIPNTDMPF